MLFNEGDEACFTSHVLIYSAVHDILMTSFFFPFSTYHLMLFNKQDMKRNSYVCVRCSCLIFELIFLNFCINIRLKSDLNISLYCTVYINFHKLNYFDDICIFQVLLPYAFSESFLRNNSPYSASHAPVTDMFLQTTLNKTVSILGDAQVRSLSQRSMRIKNTFQNMKDKLNSLEIKFMLHNQQMEIKSENLWFLTKKALWKRQN
jgi:hypothetical protein